MAKRIVMKCQSQLIPAEPAGRRNTMANLICKHEWDRDFDDNQDYFTSLGLFDGDNIKCYFLLDNGVSQGQAPEVRVYRWDGNRLDPKTVYPALVNYLKHIPFGRQPATAGLSDEEYLASYGQLEFDRLVAQRTEQRERRRRPTGEGGVDGSPKRGKT
ncbi:hypothetical protein BN1723_000899 [Verticillium longisporum]|uniref:Uncharacterized protein n=1 Tax=Verticillium longisporum TaxID=100787 RepID=A0A0G4NCQ5_VERLO|nr:hypothetical protein HYQ46_009483 [Verticillium longisporum]CRK11396.1 hypothetical protein BN1708_010139 [Verticillium longisporum]CRK44213.1 hypothetical protein BN1723_000899 [Verticillium longisporum]